MPAIFLAVYARISSFFSAYERKMELIVISHKKGISENFTPNCRSGSRPCLHCQKLLP